MTRSLGRAKMCIARYTVTALIIFVPKSQKEHFKELKVIAQRIEKVVLKDLKKKNKIFGMTVFVHHKLAFCQKVN